MPVATAASVVNWSPSNTMGTAAVGVVEGWVHPANIWPVGCHPLPQGPRAALRRVGLSRASVCQ